MSQSQKIKEAIYGKGGISLDERIKKLECDSVDAIKEFFDEFACLKATEINYWPDDDEMATLSIEVAMENLQLNTEFAREVTVAEYMQMMQAVFCNLKMDKFNKQQEAARNGEEYEDTKEDSERELELYIFLKAMNDSKNHNSLVKKLFSLKMSLINKYAFMMISKHGEDYIEKMEKMKHYALLGNVTDYVEIEEDDNRNFTFFTLLDMKDERTYGELIAQLLKKTKTPWSPNASFDAYKEDMLRTYDRIHSSVFMPLCYIFNGMGKFKDVLEKYKL